MFLCKIDKLYKSCSSRALVVREIFSGARCTCHAGELPDVWRALTPRLVQAHARRGASAPSQHGGIELVDLDDGAGCPALQEGTAQARGVWVVRVRFCQLLCVSAQAGYGVGVGRSEGGEHEGVE